MTNIDKKIFQAFEKLFAVYRAQLWEIAQKYRLSPIMIQFLNYLKHHQNKGNTISYLSAEFLLTKSTISEAISLLKKRGYIIKEPANLDGRIKYLKLTKRGEEIVAKLQEYEKWFGQVLKKFPEKNKEAIFVFLVELLRLLKLKRNIEVLRSCLFCINFEFNKYPGEKKAHYCRLLNLRLGEKDVQIDCDLNAEAKTYRKELKPIFLRDKEFLR
ncbi:MAG: MarR family winged helix-turn-helix transcriptional regulator [Candidatus Aminicenantes bacterium]|nr:MarR family winged helix-turn-helix transcriptional regulator [Candidatus Aminicenantes bacterium]